jgi:hypothetical protein
MAQPGKPNPAKPAGAAKPAAPAAPAAAKPQPAAAAAAAPAPAAKPQPAATAASKPAAKPAGVAGAERARMISEAAYFIAQKRGNAGNPLADWLAAEKQIDQQLGQRR